jgi:ATP/maltotriose-dependent transcriptional regulator MalT
MIKHFLLLFTVFLSCFIGFSQTYLDTLKLELENQTDAKKYLFNKLKSDNNLHHKAVINNKLGLLYQYESKIDSALSFHKKALKLAYSDSENNQEIGVSFNKIGICHYYKGELDSAIIFFQKSIPFYTDKTLQANSINNLAMMYKANSNPDKAIENYLLANDIYAEIQDSKKRVSVLGNISALYNSLKDFENAKRYAEKGINIAQLSKNKDGEIACKSNLGGAYLIKEDYKLAIPYIKEAIKYYQSIEKYQFLIIDKNNLANCYDGLGEKQQALSEYESILKLMDETGLNNNKESILLNLGSSYFDLKDYNQALNYSNQGLQFAKDNEVVYLYETAYKQLAEIHQALNQIDSVLFYKDLQIALKDSLDQAEKEKKMMELEAQHHNQELTNDLNKTSEILDDAQHKKELFSKGLKYALLIILITVFGVVLFYQRYKKKKLLAEELIIRNKKNKANISSLESTLEQKDELIEDLSYREETGKLPYPKNLEPLTERETEVLIGVKDGLKDKEIAERLFLSVATIRTHLRKAYVKIDVRNRAEAIQFISEFEI